MKRNKVKSSNLASVGYDSSARTLEIEFYRGGIYQYSNVPQTVYLQLMKAESLGKFFHVNIKGVYAYKKII